ncbi:MAG: hypothetical protein WCG42_06805, partial [Parachlamydiaceae bacterium]
ACAGYPLGKITQELGWTGFFWAMAGCSLISILLLVPLWNIKKASPVEGKSELQISNEQETNAA